VCHLFQKNILLHKIYFYVTPRRSLFTTSLLTANALLGGLGVHETKNTLSTDLLCLSCVVFYFTIFQTISEKLHFVAKKMGRLFYKTFYGRNHFC